LETVQAISSQEAIPRSIRHIPSKTSKAFDTLHHCHTQDSLQIEALQTKQDEQANKRQKKLTKSLQISPESRQLKRREPGKGRPGNNRLPSASNSPHLNKREGCGYHTGISKAEGGRGRG